MIHTTPTIKTSKPTVDPAMIPLFPAPACTFVAMVVFIDGVMTPVEDAGGVDDAVLVGRDV
jgi:hypothetical protein